VSIYSHSPVNHSFRHTLMLYILIAFTLSLASPASARTRFVEGDWVAWPDMREFVAFEVGRNTVYLGTNNGVLRWDRVKGKWLDPWFSVPDMLGDGIFLTGVINVEEDPLTEDVWVQQADGWVLRDHGLGYWVRKTPDEGTLGRLRRNPTVKINPDPGLISPYMYTVHGQDHSLHHRNQEWAYDGGLNTPWGAQLYTWSGFGVGIIDKYSPVLHLYPQGTGPSPGMVVTDSTIWSAGKLSHDGGWLWKKNRDEPERWYSFDPAAVWGLEQGDVQSMEVDEDGTLWIATNKGLMFGNGKTFRHLRKTDDLPSERINDVQPMKGGAWIATRNGLAFIEKKTAKVIRPDKKTEHDAALNMWSQLAADGDTLYVSGPSYLMRHVKNGPWEEIDVTSTVGSGTDPTALWAERGYIALGDKQGIAWRTSKGEWRQAFNHLWGDGFVFDIDFHGGYFWLGTDRGLAKYDPTQGDAILYTTEEGLPGNVIYEVHGENNYIWLGTDVALARFLWNAEGRLD
jgi:Two component regulator propeller